MTVHDLLRALDQNGLLSAPAPHPSLKADLDLAGLAYDSRRVSPGSVFVAVRGERFDGSVFAPEAVARGAVAVVSESAAPGSVTVPWVRVADARLALAVLSARYFGEPSHRLLLVGITGTNGKTTTSYLVRAILEQAGYPCGLIGTVQYSVGAELFDAPRTTPESLDLQEMLRRMVDTGARACSMEVSSHALDLRRVDATRFAAAVFTNLTRDHLDFHGDMDRYFAAKRRLFDLLPPGAPAVVNIDDPRGAELARTLPHALTYGLSPDAHVRPSAAAPSLDGLVFDALTPAGSFAVTSRLIGQFNLYNLLSAIATGVALDLPVRAIQEGLSRLSAVPGRLEVVSGPDDDVTAVVDYAHTDDALKNLLEAVRPLVKGRLVTVFGCGGDRDRTKRPLMGAVAARLSDVVIVTSDNPRSEDPERIIDEVERGIGPGGSPWFRLSDRREAIARAIAEARPRDVVVVAGKGHEKYQIVGTRVLPFDDAAVVRRELEQRRQAHVS